MRWWAPLLLAVQFLTRLPVPMTARLSAAEAREGLMRAVGWFPLVGAGIGAVTAGVALAAAMLWPVYVAVPLALAVEARLTGAFHEDAVADFCDAFGGGATGDDVLRIMKDSRIGSYGTLGLILAVAMRAALTIAIVTSQPAWDSALAIVAAAAGGRWLAVAVMATVPPVGTGLGKDVGGRVGGMTLALASLCALPMLAIGPVRMVAGVGAGLVFLEWFRRLLLRRIGGSTGDGLGFAAYAGQLIVLAAAALR